MSSDTRTTARMPAETCLPAVLAAGQASRFGGGKLDAACAGQPLGKWALDRVAEAGMGPGVIVAGRDVPRFAEAASDWAVLTNPEADRGLGTSVAVAASAAQVAGCGLLVLLADMPLVSADLLQRLVKSGGLSATVHPDGEVGVPAFIPHALLGEFTALSGDRGAGGLLKANPSLRRITPRASELVDVDTPVQLAEVAKLLD